MKTFNHKKNKKPNCKFNSIDKGNSFIQISNQAMDELSNNAYLLFSRLCRNDYSKYNLSLSVEYKKLDWGKRKGMDASIELQEKGFLKITKKGSNYFYEIFHNPTSVKVVKVAEEEVVPAPEIVSNDDIDTSEMPDNDWGDFELEQQETIPTIEEYEPVVQETHLNNIPSPNVGRKQIVNEVEKHIIKKDVDRVVTLFMGKYQECSVGELSDNVIEYINKPSFENIRKQTLKIN